MSSLNNLLTYTLAQNQIWSNVL